MPGPFDQANEVYEQQGVGGLLDVYGPPVKAAASDALIGLLRDPDQIAGPVADVVLPVNPANPDLTGLSLEAAISGMIGKKAKVGANIIEAIRKLARKAYDATGKNGESVKLQGLSKQSIKSLADAVQADTGVRPDLENVERFLTYDGMRHGFKGHGFHADERALAPPQNAIVPEDMPLVPGLLDTKGTAYSGRNGEHGLVHRGGTPTGRMHYIETLTPDHKRMETKTFYEHATRDKGVTTTPVVPKKHKKKKPPK